MPLTKRTHRTQRYCTFCGKSQHDVFMLIAGPALGDEVQFICDECVESAREIVADKRIKDACTPAVDPYLQTR